MDCSPGFKIRHFEKTQGVKNSKLKEKTSYLKVKTQALDNFIIDSSFFLQIKWIFLMILQFSNISTEAIQLFHKKWTNILENLDLCLILKEKTQGFDKTKNSLCQK